MADLNDVLNDYDKHVRLPFNDNKENQLAKFMCERGTIELRSVGFNHT